MTCRIVISACLAGLQTRYDGTSRPHPRLAQLATWAVLVPVCPEILGGLGIPRTPCNFLGGDGHDVLRGEARIVDRNGTDLTASFVRGATEVLRVVELVSPHLIVFKEGSPSCGVRKVDFGGSKRPGCGVVTAMLAAKNIPVLSEEDPLEEGQSVFDIFEA
jgi:uncharacterized protein YbbK (DUF523 family)